MLLHEDGVDRAVTFFREAGRDSSPVTVGAAQFSDWPIIDGNGDEFADLLVPTTARDGVALFEGSADRRFRARFQATIDLPSDVTRVFASIPSANGTSSSSVRSLRQLARPTSISSATVSPIS
jgi:hypothetical protein